MIYFPEKTTKHNAYLDEVITTDCVYKDGKYWQMALISFGTQTTELYILTGERGPPSQTKTMQNIVRWL